MPSLFDPIRLGAIDAKNRVVMAPLTRGRATDDHVPTPLMADYYAQRAGAGLIISEGTGVSKAGLGWPRAPGLWSDAQVEAWKPVTAAVHEAGGRIVAQLWHLGRMARPDVTGSQSLAPSALRAGDPDAADNPYGTPRAATHDDVARAIEAFARAGRNALSAGFDGVEVHGANGYLIDEFLKASTNRRDDDYGGSPENRIRLLREVVAAVIAEVGRERTGVRLSPNGDIQGAVDDDPASVFVPAARALNTLGIAFLELRELGTASTRGTPTDQPKLSPLIREAFDAPLILNDEYDLADAQAQLDRGVADAVSFGRKWLANPDLVERFRRGAPLNRDDTATHYTPGAAGYTDYPALARAA